MCLNVKGSYRCRCKQFLLSLNGSCLFKESGCCCLLLMLLVWLLLLLLVLFLMLFVGDVVVGVVADVVFW